MKIQVKPIGYKFRVTNKDGVFDIESTTELSMTKSDEIIRKFFDNFIIRKSEIRVSSEDIAVGARPAVKNETRRSVKSGANHTMNNIMRPNRRTAQTVGARLTEKPIRTVRRVVEKKPVRTAEKNIAKVAEKTSVRTAEKNTAKVAEKNTAKVAEKNAAKVAEKNAAKSTAGLAENIRESVKNKWRKLGRSLNDEFTLQEYIKSLRDAGYTYTNSSWEALPYQQISRLVELGEIEKIGRKKPFMYRKIKTSTIAKSEKSRELLKI